MVIPGSFAHARGDTDRCSEWLAGRGLSGDVRVKVVNHDDLMTVFDIEFGPPPHEHLPDYPDEHVRITVRKDGAVYAVPVRGDERSWLHRYPSYSQEELVRLPRTTRIPWEHLVGSLCLEYPNDPAHLRWHWNDGLDAFLRTVQRHLWFEEFHRRNGNWPVEDAPHGHPSATQNQPVMTPELRSA